MRFPKDAAKVISLGAFGYFADQQDLEFICPMLLTPFILSVLQRFGSRPVITKGIYAICTGYVLLQNLHAPNAVPKNLRIFMDKNCGTTQEALAGFRRDCSAHGWITKEFASKCSAPDAARIGIRKCLVSMAKMQLLTVIAKMAMSRSLKVNVKRNVVVWGRTSMYLYSIFMMVGFSIDYYNKLIHHFIDSDEIDEYRPSKKLQFVMMALYCLIGINIVVESKHGALASISLCNALMTRSNKYGVDVKAFLPIISYLFSQNWSTRTRVP